MFKAIAAASVLMFSVVSFAQDTSPADPPQGTVAPGHFHCSVTYWGQDTSITPALPPPGCFTCTPISATVIVQPPEFNLASGMTYMFVGAKQANVQGTDGQLVVSGSAQINADGYTNGMAIVRQGAKEIGRATGPVVAGSALEVELPVTGVTTKYKGRDMAVTKMNLSCDYQP